MRSKARLFISSFLILLLCFQMIPGLFGVLAEPAAPADESLDAAADAGLIELPEAYPAYGREPMRGAEALDQTLDDALNVPGGSIHFTTGGNGPFVPVDFGDRLTAGAYGPCYATLTFTISMAQDSALFFEFNQYYYWIGDAAELLVNGQPSGWIDEKIRADGWTRAAYVAESTGEYSFELNVRLGENGFFHLDNFEYAASPADPALGEALNVPGGSLEFITFGHTDFTVEQQDGRTAVMSNSFYENFSCSVLRSLPVYLEAGQTLTFDYKAHGATTAHKFGFYANDKALFMASTYDNDEQWHSYTFTAPASKKYSFEWVFLRCVFSESAQMPCVFIDEIGIDRPGAIQTVTIDEALNVPGGELHFESSGTRPFYTEQLFGKAYAMCGAQYYSSGSGSLGITLQLDRNESFSFDYRTIGSHDNGYGMDFYVNDQRYVQTNGGAQPDGWVHFTFLAEEAGEYRFRWESVCGNASQHHFLFQAYLDNVTIEAPFDEELSAALNVSSGDIRFYTFGPDTYYPITLDGRYCAASDTENKRFFQGQIKTEYIYLNAGQSISFDYYLDFEDEETRAGFAFIEGIWDRLSTFPNRGNIGEWLSFSHVVEESGVYQFSWRFHGNDLRKMGRVLIDNVRIRAGGSGDVDHSGSVTVADAILALRAAMGLSELPDWEFIYADMNADGSITLSDAIAILRVAMSLE